MLGRNIPEEPLMSLLSQLIVKRTVKQIARHFAILLVAILMMTLMTACTSQQEQMAKIIAQQTVATEKTVDELARNLDNGSIRNASILSAYAQQLTAQRPELAELTHQIAKDATVKGPLFQSLKNRLADAKASPETFLSQQQQLDELKAIQQAAQRSMFNDALSDPINVMADLSNNTLARVNSISREAELQANNAQQFGAGSQLMGNPNYGQWQVDNNGMSFWEWYGMYALFSSLTDNRRYYYRDWGRHRGYSYYNDYGRDRYSSPRQRKADNATYNRTKKSFAASGKRFTGPYSKRRTGSSSLSRASHTAAQRSTFSKRSSYANTSTYSNKNSGSMRNNSSRTSRSYSRGK